MNTLLSNILARFISEWKVYNRHQNELANAKKQQLMHSMQVVYDEAANLLDEEPELIHFCNMCRDTVKTIDPQAAVLHFSTHKKTEDAD